jgi:beta-glucosidase
MAAAALLLAALAAASAAPCDYTPSPNVDFNNGDLPNQPASKALSAPAECAALCCATAGCGAFSLNAGAPGGRWCYLKDGVSSSPAPTAGVDSGCLAGAECAAPPPGVVMPWFNVSLPRAARVAALIAAMSLPEAISWLNDDSPALPRLGIPAFSWEAEALHGVSWNGVATVFPENIAWGATFDAPLVAAVADAIATEARAKFVASLGADGSVREFASLSFMTPNNNLFVDPRWGRGQETYGEDPLLTSAITAALVRGLQEAPAGSPPSPYRRMLATSKHWLAYHIESSHGDGQYRLSHSFNLSDTDIAQYYVKPFAAAVAVNVSAVMCDYSGANGTLAAWPHPSGAEPWGVPSCLHNNMADLLRGQLGFTGYVISDQGAITFAGPGYHGFTSTLRDAACLAMAAGTDLALGGEYHSTLAACVSQGNVTRATLDRALTRTLSALFDTGYFDTVAALQQGFPDPVPWNKATDADVASPANLALAQRVAAESLVLLKNDAGALPLNPPPGSIVALIGPAGADSNTSIGQYVGNYAGCEDGPGGARSRDARCAVATLQAALAAAAARGGWTLRYARGSDVNSNDTSGFAAALDAAAGADVVIFAGGIDTCQEASCSEGEANDRATDGGRFPYAGLDLGGAQPALLAALVAAKAPAAKLVVVLFNGGPISSPLVFAAADAVLEAWYPGVRGGPAIADALLGAASPSGRLPVTIVRGVADLPPYLDTVLSTPPGRTHMYFSGTPLRPFGFGLGYDAFHYSALVAPATVRAGDAATIAATVTRAGAFSGDADEVALLFGSFDGPSTGAASVPRQQLLGFQRVAGLRAGESRSVSFALAPDALALVAPGGAMTVSPGTWTIWVGGGPPSAPAFGGGDVLQGALRVV